MKLNKLSLLAYLLLSSSVFSTVFAQSVASSTITSGAVNGAGSTLIFSHDPTLNGALGVGYGNVGGFTFGTTYQPVSWTNGPAIEPNYIDDIWSFGSNVGTNGYRKDTTKASLGLTFESKFFTGNVFGHEFHLQGVTASGAHYRPLSFWVGHDGSEIGSKIAANYLDLSDSSDSQIFKVDMKAKGFNFNQGAKMIFGTNNVPIAVQKNAEGNTFMTLPFIDSANVLTASQPLYVSGKRPGKGAAFPSSFVAFQPTTAQNNDKILTLSGPKVTGNYYGLSIAAPVTGGLITYIENQAIAPNANAQQILQTDDPLAGDPYITYKVMGNTTWSTGVDNSDGGKYKISQSSALGNNDRVVIDSSGNIGVGTASPKAKLDVNGKIQIGSATAPTGITIFDTVTKAPFCISVTNGQLVPDPGTCK